MESSLRQERSTGSEGLLIQALHRRGPQTIEALSSTSGLSWSQVFMAIDRLSRSGMVALRRSGRGEYQVSVNGAR
jgi:DNA-binding MarR family transcriptional regulator